MKSETRNGIKIYNSGINAFEHNNNSVNNYLPSEYASNGNGGSLPIPATHLIVFEYYLRVPNTVYWQR